MNEAAARNVLLVRAVEGSDAAGKVLTQEDRGYAGRAAAELVRWQASDQGERATEEAFIAKRAELLAAKLAERLPKAIRRLAPVIWRSWIGLALPVAAFIVGIVVEHVADRQHVNILAFPLLGLIAWNLAVYLWLIAWGVISLATGSSRKPGWMRRMLAGAGATRGGRSAGPLSAALGAFGLDYVQRAAPLVAARVLHLSAAMLALGGIAGLYLRGLAFEYRAGWEPTL